MTRRASAVTRHDAGDGTYLEHELKPRSTTTVSRKGRAEQRDVEAYCRIKTGPVSFAMCVFDPKVLAEIGWALLTASHRLARLQGPAPAPADDPQLTIYDELETG